MIRRLSTSLLTIVAIALIVIFACDAQSESPTGAVVQAMAAQGSAAPSNNDDANILVLVTNPTTGAGITGLTKSDFFVVNQFQVPGQKCGFSNQITDFIDVGTGAYRIQVKTHSTEPPARGCYWVAGDYLGQIIVQASTVKGQAAFLLSIKNP